MLSVGNDGNETAKVLDFGIAVIADGVNQLSRTHGILLTPHYAAPEQWRGTPAAELDGRVDLYALGGVLYEMLTGRTPYHANNMEGWMFEHLRGDPEPLENLRPDLAIEYPGLSATTMRLLAREREERFASATDLIDALSLLPSAANTARRVANSIATAVAKAPAKRRIPTVALTAAAAVLTAGLGIWFLTTFSRRIPVTSAPVLTPGGGTYARSQFVAISDSTPNSTIHFTVDGSMPSETSPVYVHPLSLQANRNIIRAMATANDHGPSSDVTGVYFSSEVATSQQTTTPVDSYEQAKAGGI